MSGAETGRFRCAASFIAPPRTMRPFAFKIQLAYNPSSRNKSTTSVIGHDKVGPIKAEKPAIRA
jgi:hypothetical protein